MEKFDIEIPGHLIEEGKHKVFNSELLSGKSIIGMLGYAKSGKDTITNFFTDTYGYKRVGFADNVKRDMNLYLKEGILNDYFNRSGTRLIPDEVDFFTENLELKNIIRPYIVWYAESMRIINGPFCWMNKAFSMDAKGFDKIILSDVRRMAELDIFRNSNQFQKRSQERLIEAGIFPSKSLVNDFSTLLFEISQYGLTDIDTLTLDTVRVAHEQWLVDDTFFIDPRIPEIENWRKKAIQVQVKKIVKKFGIEKPQKTKNKQITIYSSLEDQNQSSS